MKKILIFTLATFVLSACQMNTPEEAAKESFERTMNKINEKAEARKQKCDSLYKIAAGYDSGASKLTRMMACQELEEETPNLNIDYGALKQAIREDSLFEFKKRNEDE